MRLLLTRVILRATEHEIVHEIASHCSRMHSILHQGNYANDAFTTSNVKHISQFRVHTVEIPLARNFPPTIIICNFFYSNFDFGAWRSARTLTSLTHTFWQQQNIDKNRCSFHRNKLLLLRIYRATEETCFAYLFWTLLLQLHTDTHTLTHTLAHKQRMRSRNVRSRLQTALVAHKYSKYILYCILLANVCSIHSRYSVRRTEWKFASFVFAFVPKKNHRQTVHVFWWWLRMLRVDLEEDTVSSCAHA